MQSYRNAYLLRRLITTGLSTKPVRMLSAKTQYYNSDGYYCDTAMATAGDPYDLASGVPPPDILEASSKYIVQATLSLHKVCVILLLCHLVLTFVYFFHSTHLHHNFLAMDPTLDRFHVSMDYRIFLVDAIEPA